MKEVCKVLPELRRKEIALRKISLAIRREYKIDTDPRVISIIGEKIFNLSPYEVDCAIQEFAQSALVF